MRIEKRSIKRWDREIFWTRMLFKLRRKRERKRVSNCLLKMKRRSSKIKLRDTKQRHLSCNSLFINLKKTSKNMVLRHLKQTQSTINALNKSNSKTIWSQSFKEKILKLKVGLSNSKHFMKLLDQTEICIQRIFLKHRRKLQSWKWSSDVWLNKSLTLRKKSFLKMKQSLRRKRRTRSMLSKMLLSRVILRRSQEISRALRKWSKHRKVTLLDSNMS